MRIALNIIVAIGLFAGAFHLTALYYQPKKPLCTVFTHDMCLFGKTNYQLYHK